jgi:hypothetical protein
MWVAVAPECVGMPFLVLLLFHEECENQSGGQLPASPPHPPAATYSGRAIEPDPGHEVPDPNSSGSKGLVVGWVAGAVWAFDCCIWNYRKRKLVSAEGFRKTLLPNGHQCH